MNQVGPSQKAYDYIVEQIQSGEWKPGDKIMSEMDLCSVLNVSRVSVRQALDYLSGVGLLIKKHGSGTYVSRLEASHAISALIPLILIEKKELLMLLEYRLRFEPSYLDIFIEKATDADIGALRETYETMVANPDNPEVFYYADFRFHNLIARGTMNAFIIKISDILIGIMKSHQAHLYESIGPIIGITFHKKILEAIEDKDKDMAILLMQRHIQETITQYKQHGISEE